MPSMLYQGDWVDIAAPGCLGIDDAQQPGEAINTSKEERNKIVIFNIMVKMVWTCLINTVRNSCSITLDI